MIPIRCTGKLRHITKQDASKAADDTARLFWKKGEDRLMNAYFCKKCYYWHVGALDSRPRSNLRPLHKPLHKKEI